MVALFYSAACVGAGGSYEADHAPMRMETPVAVAAAQSPVMPPEDATRPPRPEDESPRDPLRAPDDVAAPPADATFTSSGLATRVVRAGHGTHHPDPHDRVIVHYTGWTTDGQMFDSSVARGSSATFPLNAVIPGFREGVLLMVEGEVRRLWIPENLAYKGRQGAPQGMLVFDVELLTIEAATPLPSHLNPAHGATP